MLQEGGGEESDQLQEAGGREESGQLQEGGGEECSSPSPSDDIHTLTTLAAPPQTLAPLQVLAPLTPQQSLTAAPQQNLTQLAPLQLNNFNSTQVSYSYLVSLFLNLALASYCKRFVSTVVYTIGWRLLVGQ